MGVVFYEGNYQGIASLFTFNSVMFRVALASYVAYLLSQLLDIKIFNHLKNLTYW